MYPDSDTNAKVMSGRSWGKRCKAAVEMLQRGLLWLLKEEGMLRPPTFCLGVILPAAWAPGASKNEGATCTCTSFQWRSHVEQDMNK